MSLDAGQEQLPEVEGKDGSKIEVEELKFDTEVVLNGDQIESIVEENPTPETQD